jgi:tetratricopeptide (TPR) repeat protein
MFFGLARVGMHVKRVAKEAPQVELPNNRGNIVTKDFFKPITPQLYRWSQPKILLHYLRIFIAPINLCFEYPINLVASRSAPDVIVPLLMWFVLLAGMAWCFMRRTLMPVLFGMSWFLAVMLPRAIAPSQELVCDYKTYIGSVGLMFILAAAIMYGLEHAVSFVQAALRQRMLMATLAGSACVVLLSAHVRNGVWKSEMVFWQDVVNKVPNRARAFNNLAVAYLVENNVEKATELFKQSIAIDNNYGEPLVNLGLMYHRLGDRAQATHYYELALLNGEQHPELYYNLALFNKSGNEIALAEQAFKKALELRPFYPVVRYEFAQFLNEQGKYDQTIELCEETFRHQAEGSYPTVGVYAEALFHAGRHAQAKEALLQSDLKQPYNAFMLGCCFFEEQDYERASTHFEFAYQCNRHDVNLAYNYGQTLMHLKEYDRALDVLGRCNNVVEQLPYVPYYKACCLNGLGKKDEAKTVLASLVESSKNMAVRQEAQSLLRTI